MIPLCGGRPWRRRLCQRRLPSRIWVARAAENNRRLPTYGARFAVAFSWPVGLVLGDARWVEARSKRRRSRGGLANGSNDP